MIDFTDTLIERPIEFSVKKKHFKIYHASLGVSLLRQKVMAQMGIDVRAMSISPAVEMLRLVTEKRKECCLFLSYSTCKEKEEVLCARSVNWRAEFFEKHIEKSDLATLLTLIFQSEQTEKIMEETGMVEEQENLRSVAKVKNTKNSLSFGGRTIYGTLIDAACERYGWTYDYTVWGISYSNLRLLTNDKISSVFVTDDELKKIHIKRKEEIIKADDPKNIERILSMDWK